MIGWVAWTSLAALIIGGGGLLAWIISLKKLKHEIKALAAKASLDEASADHLMIEAAKGLVEPLKRRIEEQDKIISSLTFCKNEHEYKLKKMDEKIVKLQDKNNRLVNGINILINQLKLSNQNPMWQPNEDDCETWEDKKKDGS